MRFHRAQFALLGVAMLACGDSAERNITAPVPAPSAIRFFNYGVNAPSVHFYAGNRKMTATASGSCQAAANPPVTATDSTCLTVGIQSTSGVAYSIAAAGGLYTALDPGQYTFAGRTASASSSGVLVSSAPATVEAGKSYSYYQSGFYNATTKLADAFVVEDALPTTIDWSTAVVRFVNAIGNSQPMTLYVVNSQTAQTQAVGGAVAYKAAGAFTALAPGSYELKARLATGADAIVRTTVPFQPGHVYTITARGDMTVTSTTATNRPFLDNTANR